MVNNQMVSEDIMQSVFMKFYENMNSIINKASYKYWLFTTCRNEVYNFYRKKSNRTEDSYEMDGESIDFESGHDLATEIEMKEIKSILISEVENLPLEQKEVYLLKEYGGMSYKEIAKISEISEDLVKSRLFKTRQKLIKRISKIIGMEKQ